MSKWTSAHEFFILGWVQVLELLVFGVRKMRSKEGIVAKTMALSDLSRMRRTFIVIVSSCGLSIFFFFEIHGMMRCRNGIVSQILHVEWRSWR